MRHIRDVYAFMVPGGIVHAPSCSELISLPEGYSQEGCDLSLWDLVAVPWWLPFYCLHGEGQGHHAPDGGEAP